MQGLLEYFLLRMLPKDSDYDTAKKTYGDIFHEIVLKARIDDPLKIMNYLDWFNPKLPEVQLIFCMYSIELTGASYYSELNTISCTNWQQDPFILTKMGPFAFALYTA